MLGKRRQKSNQEIDPAISGHANKRSNHEYILKVELVGRVGGLDVIWEKSLVLFFNLYNWKDKVAIT